VDRRSFLAGAGSIALTQFLTGCGGQHQSTLKVRLLKNSIPALVLSQFRRALGNSYGLDFKTESQLEALFNQLRVYRRQPATNDPKPSGFSIPIPFLRSRNPTQPADLITLGDYWLAKAIEQKLIQPFDPTPLDNWKNLPQRWQKLVQRNEQGRIDPKGQIWAAPYRMGTTVIAYRRDKFKNAGLQPPTDWNDLWREELSRRISLLDQPREVIGLTLKKLGQSYNTQNLDQVPQLKSELQKLQQQVKLYSSTNYLQPLMIGDTWVAVGWSDDLLPVLSQERDIAVVVPASGTALWADLWVKPAAINSNPELINQWIDFCWKPDVALLLTQKTQGTSPILLSENRQNLPKALQSNNVLLPDSEVINKSEFLHTLPAKSLQQYQEYWQQMRIE
jgi:putative spermidine/putrescine transport system substrate-binding protein